MEIKLKYSGLESQFYDLSKKISNACGLELYDMVYIPASYTLRVFIMDKETGTAVIEDCVKVDKAFDPYCETETWIPEQLTLEVSSPGVYRSLKTEEHLKAALDKKILVHLNKNIDELNLDIKKSKAKNKSISGVIKGFSEANIELEFNDKIINIDLNDIKKMNLNPDFN